MLISPQNLPRQPSSLLRRYFCYIAIHVTCKLTCYKRARPYAHRGSTMHTCPLRQCPSCANIMSCRTVSTNERIRQLSMPLQSAFTNLCSCLMHTFPGYRRGALAITSNENVCLNLQNQAIQVNMIYTYIGICSELNICVCLAT